MPAMATRFVIKFPTGRRSQGFGSNNPGFGLGLALEKTIQRFHFYLNANALLEEENDRIASLENLVMFEGMLAGEFSISKHWSALLQFLGSSPGLKGGVQHSWNSTPLDFIAGFRAEYQPWFGQIGFAEDLIGRGPSVDFTAWLALGYRFEVP